MSDYFTCTVIFLVYLCVSYWIDCSMLFTSPTESLDVLASTIEELFSPVVNKNIPISEFPEHPYSDSELQVSFISKEITANKIIIFYSPTY